MDYFSLLSMQLSIELVSHVVLLTLGGVLVLHLFGAGGVLHNEAIKLSLPVLGGSLLYGIANILSFFVDSTNPQAYEIFFTLFVLCIVGSYFLLFFSVRQRIGVNSLAIYYFSTLFFGVVYLAIAMLEFVYPSEIVFLWYVFSELGGAISLFFFIHRYLYENIYELNVEAR